MENSKIIIAGAGPAGLVAANLIADAGFSVTVLEAEAALPETLRGSTFQPPTLDMLEHFGVADELVKSGRPAPKVQYRDRNGWIAEFDFGLLEGLTRHPYRLQCEQFKLSRLLATRLGRLPHARIEYSARVVAVHQDARSVRVSYSTPAGESRLGGAWLIGADGGRSQVRSAIGVRLEGFTWKERYAVISTTRAPAIERPCNVSYFADPEEWYMLLRLPELWRVVLPVPPEESDASVLSDSETQRRMQRIAACDEPYPIHSVFIYAVHQRVADRYRVGRTFLVGDAAHLNNPLGGMGLNGAIHDAFNLASKLIAFERDGIDELDRYERQRRPIALDYIDRISTANKKNLETNDPGQQRIWREKMSRTAADPELARQYLINASMIASLEKAQAYA